MPQRDNETGATFAPDEIGFIDFESLNRTTEIKDGAYRYVIGADAIILAFAIGDGPPETVAVPDFPKTLRWDDMPAHFKAHQARVACGEAVWAAWNAGFDRAVWNYSCIDFPFLQPHMVVDVMVQATASNLPPDLMQAARQCGGKYKKNERGKALIKLFSVPDSHFAYNLSRKLKQKAPWDEENKPTVRGTPVTRPKQWAEFNLYAKDDISSMRSVFKRTRQLPWKEWQEYWAGERVNERGVGIDLPLVAHAAWLAEQDKDISKQELSHLTSGAVGSVDEVKRITDWLVKQKNDLETSVIEKNLLKREEEFDEETGEVTRPAKFSLTRKRVEKLIAAVLNKPDTPNRKAVLKVLQIRLYGGSKTPAKFSKMLRQHVDGVLMGQYVFNGAAQTGRYSSRGTQVHNLARDALEHELDLIDALSEGCSYDTLAKLGNDDPVARKLSLLIRPTLVPRNDKVFVWSDWNQIEARVLPWLAGDDLRAEARLQIFRDVDADPKLPDLYTRTAADLSGLSIDQITKPLRQRGKVCFGADTQVITNNGIKAIADISKSDLVWDGVEWVNHQGVVQNGLQPTLNLAGLEVTADHLIATHKIWRRASELASNENLLCQALATGLASWLSLITNTVRREVLPIAWRNVRAERHHIECCSLTCARETPRAVLRVLQSKCTTGAKIFSATQISCLMSYIADVCSTVSQLAIRAVHHTGKRISILPTMPDAAFAFSGAKASKVAENFLPILSRSKVGIIQNLRSIESTLTETTNLETFSLRQEAKEKSDQFKPCKPASTNLKLVYDIVHAGPRNRFTVLTQRGPLLVHNCELALGFIGGVGALQNMAANYGMHIEEDEAKEIVRRWREANKWCTDFADDVWEAARQAHHFPGVEVPVGRITFTFLSNYLGGSLVMRLPSGRCLTYRAMRWELIPVLDEDDKPMLDDNDKPITTLELTFARGYGRVKLWKGIFLENMTQATAGDFLRGTLTRLESNGTAEWMPVLLHTHDEILTETEECRAAEAAAQLREIMQQGFAWSEGLPIMSEETTAWYYTKNESSYGL